VEYGGNRHGFLAFSEIHPDYYQIPMADRQALVAEEARADLPMRPSYAPAPLDAAALLAAQTSDVVTASAGPVKPREAVSLRRKRRPRESLSPRATAPSRPPKAADPSFEGQVAGLRSLRNGG